MSELRVDPTALDQLSEAFRIVAAMGIPSVSAARTGHTQLDEAISELRNAVDAINSHSQTASDSQACSVQRAAAGYGSTEESLARTGGLR